MRISDWSSDVCSSDLFKGVDLKGKIALVLVNDPDYETGGSGTGGSDFGGKAMTYYGRWTYKYEEAARQGATGMLVIRNRAGLLRLGHGEELQHQHHVRRGARGSLRHAPADGRLGPEQLRGRTVQGGGKSTRLHSRH